MGLDLNILKNRQVVLLVLGLIPGILASANVISSGQATMGVMILFVLSRKFAKASQQKFDLNEAEREAAEKRLASTSGRRSKKKD